MGELKRPERRVPEHHTNDVARVAERYEEHLTTGSYDALCLDLRDLSAYATELEAEVVELRAYKTECQRNCMGSRSEDTRTWVAAERLEAAEAEVERLRANRFDSAKLIRNSLANAIGEMLNWKNGISTPGDAGRAVAATLQTIDEEVSDLTALREKIGGE